jgi:NAD(P)-dependent dehydrogenase (short-subunit alcohol dehydrogenase family)
MVATGPTVAGTDLPSLAGRLAVVGGAGGGTGAALAGALARLGAAVALLDPATERPAEVAATIEAAGGRATGVEVDLADPAAVDAAAALVAERLGTADALVCCAGESPEAPLEELSLEAWDRATAVDLGGPFNCMRAFGPALLGGDSAAVVHVCPAAAPRSGAALAATAGAGLRMLARLGAVEWGNRGVRVNSVEVAPGAPLDRVATAVAFLIGDGSGYVTGESFEVNQEV